MQSSDFDNNEVLKAKFKDTSEDVYAHGTDQVEQSH